MNKTLMLALVLVMPLAGCGGDDAGAPSVPSEKGMKKLDREQKPDKDERDATGGTSEPAITPEERMRRDKLKLLKEKLGKTTDPDDRADLLGEVMGFGEHAKGLWPEVAACFKDEEPFTRGVALQAAAKIDKIKARELLERGLEDDEAEVRKMASEAWASAEIKDLTPLISRIKEEFEPSVQMAAMVTVEKIGEKHHAPLVIDILEDLDLNALKPAVRFLAEKGEPAHADRIAGFLDRDDVDLRVLVARTLEKAGRKSKPVLTNLANALIDDEDTVRKAAFAAIKALTGQEFGYDPDAPEAARQAAVKAAKAWIDKNS